MENVTAEKLKKMIFKDELGRSVLDRSGKRLSKFPKAVYELTELEQLNLSKNYLKELPASINKLRNLRILRLDRNQLRELPHSICELSNLTCLSVGYNQLSVLPSNIKNLKNLRELYLSNNQLTTLPDGIADLKDLRWLYVNNNKLTVLTSQIKHLKNLQGLHLINNQLTSLPDGICELKKLKWLRGAGNPLTLEDMRKVVKLQNKMKIYLKDVKGDVFEQNAEGQRAQLAYEKAIRDGFVNVYRGRILLIGQDRAGKTSLKKSLLGLPFDPKEQSTEGIQVQASTCQIEVEQVKNWHSTSGNKPVLLECSKDMSRIVAENLCDRTKELEQAHSPATTEAATMAEEEHFKEEGGRWIDGNDPNKHQFEENEHFSECRSEIELKEPEVMIDATSPPDDVTKHVHQWLEYVRGKGDVTEEESVVSMDVWDFAGQELYYASHPLFLSSRALYILVHNLSKPLLAQAQPCVRQGTRDISLKNTKNETNLENLLSWLATIHSITQVKGEPDRRLSYLRPPVLIVGTHADKRAGDIATMKEEIQKKISDKEYGKHVVRPLFSIDNTSSLISSKRGNLQTGIKVLMFGHIMIYNN